MKKFNQKRHLKAIKYHSYFSYFRKHYKTIELEDVVRQSGLSMAYLNHKKNWVSIEFDYKFHQYITGLVDDPDLAYNVGAYCYGPQKWGEELTQLVQKIESTELLIKTMIRFFDMLNGLVSVEYVEGDNDRSSFKMFLKYDILSTDREVQYAIAHEKTLYQNVAGFLVAALRSNLNDPRVSASLEMMNHNEGGVSILEILHSDEQATNSA